MRLYLLRHAKSSWKQPDLEDHDRPLSGRGRRAAEVMADHIREQEIAPDVVLCSSSRRTRETLTHIEPALPPGTVTRIERDLYGAGLDDLLARLRELPETEESALVIGHNPGLHLLALDLAGGGEELERLRTKFPTAALATLEIPGGAWSGLRTGTAELVAYVKPRDLEAR